MLIWYEICSKYGDSSACLRCFELLWALWTDGHCGSWAGMLMGSDHALILRSGFLWIEFLCRLTVQLSLSPWAYCCRLLYFCVRSSSCLCSYLRERVWEHVYACRQNYYSCVVVFCRRLGRAFTLVRVHAGVDPLMTYDCLVWFVRLMVFILEHWKSSSCSCGWLITSQSGTDRLCAHTV